MLQQLKEMLRTRKIDKSQILLVILAGILFVVISMPTKDGKNSVKTPSQDWEETSNLKVSDENLDYVTNWERRLEQILSQVKGAGTVKVILRLYQSNEQVLAEQEDTYGKEPYVVKTMEPVFAGAILVAEGANNKTVYRELQRAVASLLHLSVERISILPMESSSKLTQSRTTGKEIEVSSTRKNEKGIATKQNEGTK